MLTIGIDPHKQTHSGVGVDPLGVQIAQRTVAARREGSVSCWSGGASWTVSGSG
jgi:hypothetical protein